ncbi:hypothetical protein RirG_220130 [Rhizophagus irregularis DAOM 197198w]|uniref:Uncharacterized protein n=1 Tax=Rhizophagus irregularis (strain DAOM 197198w) TaxID=1432141 RepID=A0A015JM21_RHIIW|nr:hypothetical protein RirG_220130 [Rhizophagus irregularis DAOM 197198w]
MNVVMMLYCYVQIIYTLNSSIKYNTIHCTLNCPILFILLYYLLLFFLSIGSTTHFRFLVSMLSSVSSTRLIEFASIFPKNFELSSSSIKLLESTSSTHFLRLKTISSMSSSESSSDSTEPSRGIPNPNPIPIRTECTSLPLTNFFSSALISVTKLALIHGRLMRRFSASFASISIRLTFSLILIRAVLGARHIAQYQCS